MRFASTALISSLVFLATPAMAQTSPAELARDVANRWAATADNNAKSRVAGLASVIRTNERQSVLLISGVPVMPNSGDATALGTGFSGVYQAHAEGGRWRLDSPIPLETLGQLLAHDMNVSILPGSGITVEDRMRIRVSSGNGFALRLNHTAKIESVRAGGGNAAYLFGGGLFWAELHEGPAELTIRYSIEVEKGPEDTNSGSFPANAGHVRNQYFWHPYFGFAVGGDWAVMHIAVRIPKEYHVSTSIPQTERVEGDERIIEGQTTQPAFALTLVYDRDWKVESRTFGDTRVEFFVSPTIQPDVAGIFDEFRSVYELLSSRFGPLPGGYRAVIQANSWKDNPGWRFASNQAVVSAMNPWMLSMGSPVLVAPLGHEIAHFWTEGAAGPARNFLWEGWAVWAESAIVEREFGSAAETSFWKSKADQYFRGRDGKLSLVEDEGNGGLSYVKGPWLFHMLEGAMGKGGFDRAMTDYVRRSLESPAGWEVLAECMQRYAPADFHARSFLLPWLTEKRAPRLTTQINGRVVTIHQEPSVFDLPVVIEAITSQGRERRRVWVRSPDTIATFSSDVSEVKIDPDGALLLRR